MTCGVLPSSAEADSYYPNTCLRIQLLLLAVVGIDALVFRRSVYGSEATPSPSLAKVADVLSLALWLGVLSMGRWIAYYEKPKPVPASPRALDYTTAMAAEKIA